MSREKPPAPAPPVVSTGCSGLMSCSCLSRHRRGPQQPRRSDDGGAGDAAFEVAERCWKRVQLLEEEVKRLSGHEVRPAPGATERVVVRDRAAEGGGEATDRVGNGAKATAEGGSASTGMGTGTTAAATGRAASVGHGACCGAQEVVRLEDGSYMREVRRVGRTWERLAVQVSRPAVPADAASASEVLGKMAAMRAEDLWKFLVQLMPLKDITGQKNPGEPVRRTARPISGDDLVEALVLDAMGKLEYLVLEGLKIQMASPATEPATATAAAAGGDGRRDKAVSKDCSMVHVVLMQARDPKERYGAIGDPMIGLIEASLEMKDATTVRRRMLGLHVAGISSVMSRPSDGRCVLWSAYLRRCNDGDGGGDGCRCICVRNPDRVLPSV
ncbi:unnamed protein product [Miscanthus lutarioriparius]|uniref:PMI1/PMIR1-2 C-terminal domain-containing protein n=1 Tax=Miscanthus lutarioriparius TaxID=422564 RepID=A0A811NA51_9POAL|nr:unnamed protein product [Miscanthus lutarioriparius]